MRPSRRGVRYRGAGGRGYRLNVNATMLNVNYCLLKSLLFLTLAVFNNKTVFVR